ncbi:hypothetical protein BV22DRAFT_1050424 [Leucogyrophana mollusca]|uniref:Uncharacterized protein n=1 Tax=Leucogyrophana mollusca TaxID=85980 RepID=A0ACB8B4I2_9AGAM|nr:hypothetical protein BV22DRAFT_1050424 [Leucogyrophana mollusca]
MTFWECESWRLEFHFSELGCFPQFILLRTKKNNLYSVATPGAVHPFPPLQHVGPGPQWLGSPIPDDSGLDDTELTEELSSDSKSMPEPDTSQTPSSLGMGYCRASIDFPINCGPVPPEVIVDKRHEQQLELNRVIRESCMGFAKVSKLEASMSQGIRHHGRQAMIPLVLPRDAFMVKLIGEGASYVWATLSGGIGKNERDVGCGGNTFGAYDAGVLLEDEMEAVERLSENQQMHEYTKNDEDQMVFGSTMLVTMLTCLLSLGKHFRQMQEMTLAFMFKQVHVHCGQDVMKGRCCRMWVLAHLEWMEILASLDKFPTSTQVHEWTSSVVFVVDDSHNAAAQKNL